MSDSILKRYVPRASDEVPDARRSSQAGPATDQDTPDDLGAFGFLRGVRDRAVMLEFRKKDGSIKAKGYGWLEDAEFDPAGSITLSFSGEKVRISGRNLNAETRPEIRLFQAITRHRVPWIQEADHRSSMTVADTETVIDSIEW